MSQKRKSSSMWEFFTRINSETAKCDLCKSTFSYKTSVSNLRKHMQRKHHTVSLDSMQTASLQLEQVVQQNPASGSSTTTRKEFEPGTSNEVCVTCCELSNPYLMYTYIIHTLEITRAR